MTAEQKLASFEALMSEVSAALADTVDAIKAGQGTHDEIASTLADIAAALEKPRPDTTGDLIKAIKALRIQPVVQVQNTVQPTPVEVTVQPAAVHVQVIDRPQCQGAKVEYDQFNRITGFKLIYNKPAT